MVSITIPADLPADISQEEVKKVLSEALLEFVRERNPVPRYVMKHFPDLSLVKATGKVNEVSRQVALAITVERSLSNLELKK